MEIYRNSESEVFIELPERVITSPGRSIDVRAYENGVLIYEFDEVIVRTSPSGLAAALPWELVREDRDFFVNWEITYTHNGVSQFFQERQLVQVVTPILPLSEVARIGSDEDAVEVQDLEHRVRYAIQAYTGQNFGKYRDTIDVMGNGSNSLILPAPILAIEHANFSIAGTYLSNNGFVIKGDNLTMFSIKQAPPEDVLDMFHYTNGPIEVGSQQRRFTEDREYRITGLWGYHDVPSDVKQAARILTEDYSCDESLWRERYIESVRSGNWRFETAAGAFSGTGNVLVDQLLLPYRRLTMRIV